MFVSLVDEVSGVELGDKRLNKRLAKVVEELGAKPNLSIPGATHSRAEMEAAYRLFDNNKVTPDKILTPHFEATRKRIAQCDLVLLVQDTTELDVTRPGQQVAGAGPMDSESRRGAFVHPLMAFSLAKVPLGMLRSFSTPARSTSAAALLKSEQANPSENKLVMPASPRWMFAPHRSRWLLHTGRIGNCRVSR